MGHLVLLWNIARNCTPASSLPSHSVVAGGTDDKRWMIQLKKKKKQKGRKMSPVLEKKLKLYLFTDGESSSVGLNDSTLLPQMLGKKGLFISIIKPYLNYFNHLFGVSVYNKMNHLKPLELNSQKTALSKVDWKFKLCVE